MQVLSRPRFFMFACLFTEDLPVLIILTVVIGAIIVITTVTLVAILCHRHHRRAKDIPSGRRAPSLSCDFQYLHSGVVLEIGTPDRTH